MNPNANVGADVSLDSVVSPPPIVGVDDPSPTFPSGTGTFFLPPVVLRVLPLRGSSAPVGFIYDANPDPLDGGLLAIKFSTTLVPTSLGIVGLWLCRP